MFTVPFNAKVIRRFCYRSARPYGQIFQAQTGYDGESRNGYQRLHQRLAKECGNSPDNHDGYEVQGEDGHIFYVFFSDWTITVSRSFRPDENWRYVEGGNTLPADADQTDCYIQCYVVKQGLPLVWPAKTA